MTRSRFYNPRFDLFLPTIVDLRFRDQKDTMERPFFSLSTNQGERIVGAGGSRTGLRRVAAESKVLPTIAAVIAAAISATVTTTTAATTTTTAATTTAPATTATTAATTAAAPTTIATATTPITAAATTAFGLRLGFVHDQIASAKVLTIQAIDGFLCVFVGGNFHESEAARLPGEAIPDKRDRRRSDSNLRKPFVELVFCGGKRKVTNIELLHLGTPSVWNRRASCGGALRSSSVERRAGEKRNAAGT
jgi:hypothetical protein